MRRLFKFGLAIVLELGVSAAVVGQRAPTEATPSGEPQTTESVDTKPKEPAAASATQKRGRKGTPNAGPRKIVVREGGATEPAQQIVPGMTADEAARQRQNAEQWLSSTDSQLKQLAERNLDPRQQETVGQIRNYMKSARGALQEGDVRRASTLAEKAHLLSDDLLRR